jgi:hypothetical protein
MKKLKLEIESLAVDTFHALPAGDAALGTVEAFDGLTASSCKVACIPCTEYQTCRDCV